jgi:anti-anti-sigma regulatory factor
MKVTQRQVTIVLLVLQIVGCMLSIGVIAGSGNGTALAAAAVGAVVYVLMLLAYLRGWEYARYVVVGVVTVLTGVGLPEPYVSQTPALSILLAPVLALILAGPLWVVGSAALVWLSLVGRAGWSGVYLEPGTLVAYVMVVGGMVLARLVTDTAHRVAQEHARQAQQARASAEARAAELDVTSQQLEAELARQRSLLALVDTLETPVVGLADGVLFAPVVGHLDTRRADILMKRLLDAVHGERARTMIIDIAGVAVVDTSVAGALLRTVQGLRMLGCEVMLSGISAPVASSLVQLGVPLEAIRTVRSPEEALATIAPGRN